MNRFRITREVLIRHISNKVSKGENPSVKQILSLCTGESLEEKLAQATTPRLREIIHNL